ncbi:M24 family metallopeptidase [Marinihelvus fidelis]|uniref:Xaa-Pro aminopeptidase n=1 Tax=Marinihelvus fidelis TaxID=2613842 RepID=A0A5N0T8I9_9GAMM|nr:aminopeptidase P N-terminal domain-containing protein [Marinihelvus fidelis]KAA9130804.1 M24 family metallopeptidase [Marinihelvus fidelis]
MIKAEEYARRRRQLMRTVGEGAVVILRAAPERVRNHDVLYPYRQDSDFLYLTGFKEPDAMLVLVTEASGGRSILFCREKDPVKEMWDGAMIGLEAAVSEYGMDEAWPIGEVERRLPDLLHDRVRIVHDLGRDPAFDTQLIGWLNAFRGKPRRSFHAPDEIVELGHLLHDMRLYKSRGELSAMRRAARVSAEAHVLAMQACEPGLNEADIHATLVQHFMREHCDVAYSPIVGGGANACVLHYITNNAPLADGDLLLIDAGAEYDGYAADITRTFPVNGRFSEPQRQLYELVLAAQAAAIDRVRPGSQWEDIHEAAVSVLTDGLLALGILEGEREDALEQGLVDNYYVHKTGHWLGLDVHDAGDYQVDGHSRELEPGMVLTIEPGLYIRADDTRVDERWRGIGIRIEDDVVVTRDEPEILTRHVPKAIADIEALMGA